VVAVAVGSISVSISIPPGGGRPPAAVAVARTSEWGLDLGWEEELDEVWVLEGDADGDGDREDE
jgi:hypothetical protein